jgi:hypothetical protein
MQAVRKNSALPANKDFEFVEKFQGLGGTGMRGRRGEEVVHCYVLYGLKLPVESPFEVTSSLCICYRENIGTREEL